MKKNFPKIGFAFFAWFLVSQASHALAQTSTTTQPNVSVTDYNSVDWSHAPANSLAAILKTADPSQIPTNLWGTILQRVEWSQIPTNIQYYVFENVDWDQIPTNVWALYVKPGEWPDSPQRQAGLKRCAELLRSSVDTNWLATIVNKLTNQPAILQFTNRLNDGTETVTLVANADIVLHFEDFSNRLVSLLDEYAGYLTSPKLHAYLGDGYEAEMISPRKSEGTINFLIWSGNGPVRTFEQNADDASGSRVEAGFYENGKLGSLVVFTPGHQERANFGENGKLQVLTWRVKDHFSIQFKLDESGNSDVGGYFSK